MSFLFQISTVKEAFIDISLPIIEERVSHFDSCSTPAVWWNRKSLLYLLFFLIFITYIFLTLPPSPQISKPSNPGRLGKGSREQDSHAAHSEQVLSAAHSVNKNSRKLSGPVRLPTQTAFCREI